MAMLGGSCKGPSQGQQAYGESASWILLTSSSVLLEVDPIWLLQHGQEHALTTGVLAPWPSLLALGRFDLQRSQASQLLPSGRVLQTPSLW